MSEIILKIRRKKNKVQLIQSKQVLQDAMENRVSKLVKSLETVEDIAKPELELVEKVLPEAEIIEDIPEIIEEDAQDLLINVHKSFDDIEQEIPEPEKIKEEEVKEKPKTTYTEIYTISDDNEPIEIEFDNNQLAPIDTELFQQQVQEAYSRGFEDAKEMASVTAETKIQEAYKWVRRIDLLMVELRNHYSNSVQEFQNKLLDLAVVVAEAVIDKEISHDSNIILEQVRKALDELDDDVIFKIHVNPKDMEALKAAKSSIAKNEEIFANTIFINDSNIKPGGCVLHTSAGTIDAKISAQLSMIKENIIEYERIEKEGVDEFADYDVIPDVSKPLSEYEEYMLNLQNERENGKKEQMLTKNDDIQKLENVHIDDVALDE